MSTVNIQRITRPILYVEISQPQPVTAVSRQSTSSQSPLKCFRLFGTGHSSAAAVTVSNTVDTELIAYFADCKNYSEKQ